MKTKLLFSAGLAVGLVLVFSPTAMAQTYTIGSGTLNETIPDDDLNGLSSTINVNVPMNNITGVDLTLDISSGYNGDYYAYLQSGSGLVVLLNRLDATVSNPYGSPSSGFNVTFSDSSPNIATAPVIAGQPLTGTWAPQAGSLNSTFDGMNPNGAWTLFIADESPGGVGTLQDWSVEVTAVPEGSTMSLLVLGGGLLVLCSLPRHMRCPAILPKLLSKANGVVWTT
jgi:subtilisin-like proprotein convertase family protein